jgi:hypothetical protein
MKIANLFDMPWLGISYRPRPNERSFLKRTQVQENEDAKVTVAVLSSRESERFFGAPLARRGIQPVWLEITNRGDEPVFFDPVRLDPNYYPSAEAALINHFAILRRLAAFGALAWLFLPLLLLLPLKIASVRRANRQMDEVFHAHAFPIGEIAAKESASGFIFASVDDGTKVVRIRLLRNETQPEFVFSVPVPGLKTDYQRRPFQDLYSAKDLVECDEAMLRENLQEQPRATTNRSGAREGDPANLVMIGDFPTILSAFGARWDETETLSIATCWKTAKAFVLGSLYRYSPVSPLYLFGRSQDFALQRVRLTVNERLHLRLWLTSMRYSGNPVWVGQVSRDIGVRVTPRTWNLTTHKIDPNVDEARNYVAADLIASGHLDRIGLIGGVGVAERSAPRRNLTGDPYFTDGFRIVLMLSPTPVKTRFLGWQLSRQEI